MNKRPAVLTIAGFDPSNGAGLTADVKTLEQIGVYALSVCTANTVQNDHELTACFWTPLDIMEQQLDLLYKRFTIDYVKIGIVEQFSVLRQLIRYVKSKNAETKIILDPVLKSSSNFTFHQPEEDVLNDVLSDIYLITPNYNEVQLLYPSLTEAESIGQLQASTHVLLKGGHRPHQQGVDELYLKNGKRISFYPNPGDYSEKHGSGCILSSAITGYLALGYSLEEACKLGKNYIEKILKSNSSLLGYHSLQL